MENDPAKPTTVALPDCLRWALEYLPDYFTHAPASFHVELMRDLENPDLRLIARVAPRGHAKSTCAALAYPLWCICERRRRNLVIITHESSLAKQFVRDIRAELETNEQILAKYGDLCSALEDDNGADEAPNKQRKGTHVRRGAAAKKRKTRTRWTQDIFTTNTGVTVQAKGTGAGFRGTRVGPNRPDLIICDDIEKDEHVESPEADVSSSIGSAASSCPRWRPTGNCSSSAR